MAQFKFQGFFSVFPTSALNLLKELQEWSQDRMEELAALHAAQQLEALRAELEILRCNFFGGFHLEFHMENRDASRFFRDVS